MALKARALHGLTFVLAFATVLIANPATSQTTNWTNWSFPASNTTNYPNTTLAPNDFWDGRLGQYRTTLSGVVTDPNTSTTVNVTFTGEVRQGSGGNDADVQRYTWDGDTSRSYPLGAPSDTQGISQTGYVDVGDTKKVEISFSATVTNPVLVIGSLGNTSDTAQMLFSRDFEIVSGSTGFTKTDTAQGYELSGREAYGNIQFCGTFDNSTPLEYTITDPEIFFSVNVGLTTYLDGAIDNTACGTDISIDEAAPTLASSSPVDDANSVAVDANILLTFSEAVDTETGTIVIKKVSDGTTVESFDVATSSAISGSGTTTITVNPASNLTVGTAYYVEIASSAFDDLSGNSYAGISGATTLNFTTAADTTAPTFDVAPSVGSVTSSGFTPSASIDEAGKIYYVVVADGATAPSAAQVKAGTDYSGVTVLAAANATVSSSPFTSSFSAITSLTASTAYDVYFIAEDDEGTPNVQSSVTKVDATTSAAPDTTAPTATFSPANGATDVAVDANITITFDEAIRLVNDSALTNSNVDALITLKETNSSGSNIAFDATISGNVITVNPSTDFGYSQQVYVAIGSTVEDTSDNAYAGGSATFTVVANTQTPATEFAENEAAIRAVLVDDMMRSVRSMLSVSRRMISDARNRLIAYDRAEAILASNCDPLDLDGVARADAAVADLRGTAFSSCTRDSGAFRRLFFSDFDIQHNTDTDSTTATLSARVTWEHMTSDSTMLGYFVGVEAAESDLNGTFAGDQTRFGVSAGGYVAHKLADQLYMDAYVSVGVGHSEPDMSNGTLALESDYRSETVTTGAAISGSYEYDAYEFRPELAFNYGKTELGQVFFTGRAYGLVDDTLTLNAGSVSVANLTLRPEIRMDVEEVSILPGAGIFSFSPRLICERTMSTRRAQNCGGGAEFGYAFQSKDGLRNIDLNIAMDEVGSDRRTSAVLGVEMQF